MLEGSTVGQKNPRLRPPCCFVFLAIALRENRKIITFVVYVRRRNEKKKKRIVETPRFHLTFPGERCRLSTRWIIFSRNSGGKPARLRVTFRDLRGVSNRKREGTGAKLDAAAGRVSRSLWWRWMPPEWKRQWNWIAGRLYFSFSRANTLLCLLSSLSLLLLLSLSYSLSPSLSLSLSLSLYPNFAFALSRLPLSCSCSAGSLSLLFLFILHSSRLSFQCLRSWLVSPFVSLNYAALPPIPLYPSVRDEIYPPSTHRPQTGISSFGAIRGTFLSK